MAALHDMEVDEYLRRSVSVEPMALQEEFVSVSADLAYWSSRFALALRDHLKARASLKRLEARLYLEARASPGPTGKPATEGDANAYVQLRPEHEAATLASIEAEAEKSRLYGLVDAVRAKRDALVDLGATSRKEMDSDPLIREQRRLAREFAGGR